MHQIIVTIPDEGPAQINVVSDKAVGSEDQLTPLQVAGNLSSVSRAVIGMEIQKMGGKDKAPVEIRAIHDILSVAGDLIESEATKEEKPKAKSTLFIPDGAQSKKILDTPNKVVDKKGGGRFG